MSIERKCENCCVCDKAGDETHDIYKCLCSDDRPCFSPKEEIVREDERRKIMQELHEHYTITPRMELVYNTKTMKFEERLYKGGIK